MQCHPQEEYQNTSTDCVDCHNLPDIHFETDEDCDSCHTIIGWKPAEYDHSFYPLIENHQEADCIECHIDYQYKDTSSKCESCHGVDEEHEYNIATNCDACHNLNEWQPAVASHSVFPLTLEHSGQNCVDCHESEDYTAASSSCESCHNLPDGHFNTPNYPTSEGCGGCHTIEGWSPADFDHSTYALRGAHTEVECVKCYTGNRYSGTSRSCESCHNSPSNHPVNDDSNCNECHKTTGWKPARYDHSGLTLSGEHKLLSCRSCHKNGEYDGLSSSCQSCHSSPVNHPVGSVGNCGSCHSQNGWLPANYDHSGFALTGEHKNLSCSSCHSGGNYGGLSSACVSCHSGPSTHSGLSQSCLSCHMVNAFTPSIFRHPQVGEHIPRGEKRLQCSSCHKPRYSSSTCIGSGCHSSNNPRDD